MYVCLCNGYRDAEIREVAESGVRCVEEVYLTLGNGPCCRRCLDFAQDIVDSAHGGMAGGGTAETAVEEPAAPAGDALLMAAE